MPIITFPSNTCRSDPGTRGRAALFFLTLSYKAHDKGRFIQSNAPGNKRQAGQCDTSDHPREVVPLWKTIGVILKIDQEAQDHARLMRLPQDADPSRLEAPGDRWMGSRDEAVDMACHQHAVIRHPGGELARGPRL